MSASAKLPFAADAVAVCGGSSVALFDAAARRVTTWAYALEKGFVETAPVAGSVFVGQKKLATSVWCAWEMAENAAVITCITRDGHLAVLTRDRYAEYPGETYHRIIQTDSGGEWAYLQRRADAVKVDLRTGATLKTYASVACVYEDKTHVARLESGLLIVTREGKTHRAPLAAPDLTPVSVHVGGAGTIYVVFTHEKDNAIITTVHEWSWGEMLSRKKTMSFKKTVYGFTTVGADERWCCLWPNEGGHVVKNADGHGNAITCVFPPIHHDGLMYYVMPSDPRQLVVV